MEAEKRPADASEVEEGAAGAGGRRGGHCSVALLDAAVRKNAVVRVDAVVRVGQQCGRRPWPRRCLRSTLGLSPVGS